MSVHAVNDLLSVGQATFQWGQSLVWRDHYKQNNHPESDLIILWVQSEENK